MKKIILAVLALVILSDAEAQTKHLADLKAARDLSAQSMKLFADQKFGPGIELLRPYFPLSDDDIINLISKTEENMPMAINRFGAIEGYSKVSEKMLGETMIREVYTLNFANYPLRFLYVYYKSKSGWLLISFKWDDSIDEEW